MTVRVFMKSLVQHCPEDCQDQVLLPVLNCLCDFMLQRLSVVWEVVNKQLDAGYLLIDFYCPPGRFLAIFDPILPLTLSSLYHFWSKIVFSHNFFNFYLLAMTFGTNFVFSTINQHFGSFCSQNMISTDIRSFY